MASIGAFFCFQRALQSGKPTPVIALMTAGNNIVSSAHSELRLAH